MLCIFSNKVKCDYKGDNFVEKDKEKVQQGKNVADKAKEAVDKSKEAIINVID